MFRGPAQNIACLTAFVAQLPTFLLAYGSLAGILALGQLLAMILGCCLCCQGDYLPDSLDEVAYENDNVEKE